MSHCKKCDRYDKQIKALEKKRALLERRLEEFDMPRRKGGFIKQIAWFIKKLLGKIKHGQL